MVKKVNLQYIQSRAIQVRSKLNKDGAKKWTTYTPVLLHQLAIANRVDSHSEHRSPKPVNTRTRTPPAGLGHRSVYLSVSLHQRAGPINRNTSRCAESEGPGELID